MDDPKYKRRFPRVRMSQTMSNVTAALAAQLTWPNHEISEIQDLAYKGCSASRPGMFEIKGHEIVDVEIELGGEPKFQVKARVVWNSHDWIGMEFLNIPAEGHAAMTEFLDAKLVGSVMKKVETVFVGPGQSFTHWFQGTGVTHVFVWTNSAKLIDRVTVDMGGKIVEFKRGEKHKKLDSAKRRALLVISQMDKPELPMEEFVRTLILGV